MPTKEHIERMERDRDELVKRLEKGWTMISEGKAEGKNVTKWEDAWVTLLHQYEELSDRIQRPLEG